MTDTDEIDTRRARVLAGLSSYCVGDEIVSQCISETDCPCLQKARAIRLSDEAAGYDLVKRVEHEGKIG